MVVAFFKIWAILAVILLTVHVFFRLLETRRRHRYKSKADIRADYQRALRAEQARANPKTRIVSFESRPDR